MSFKTGTNPWILFLVVTAATIASQAQQSVAQNGAPSQCFIRSGTQCLVPSGAGSYAPTEVCQTCHQDVWDKHVANTPHSALLKGDQHGCQGCHGPAQAHVDGGGDTSKIICFSTLGPQQTAAVCMRCHQSTPETQNFSKSEHLANGVSCTSCHSPHKSEDVNFLL